MNVAVIGAGPAGLRAAEVAVAHGASVTLFDAKPSPGRKFLVAGRGGLNLSAIGTAETMATRYSRSEAGLARWNSLLQEFDTDALRAWASSLGIETFAASTGRVYPKGLKAAPLLRAWVRKLKDCGARFEMRSRLVSITPGAPLSLGLLTAAGHKAFEADAVVLAMGGGSWPETGSDGAWVGALSKLGIKVAPLEPANCGWECDWPADARVFEGQPCKNVVVSADGARAAGELLITRYGLEGGALYQLGSKLREMAAPSIRIDFKPDVSVERLVARLAGTAGPLAATAKHRWRLSDAAWAIVESGRGEAGADSPESLAMRVKGCEIRLLRPRPLAEAISSAGGVEWDELDEMLMFKRAPGLYAAGEMVGWEAPTGGYLIHGCLAMGGRAGQGAADWARAAGRLGEDN